jgi:hypothetical protein
MGDHVAVDVGGLIASRAGEEVEALIGMVECRICQEEDLAKNLESPCACSGSLKVHAFSELGFCSQFILLMLFSLKIPIDLGT